MDVDGEAPGRVMIVNNLQMIKACDRTVRNIAAFSTLCAVSMSVSQNTEREFAS